MKTVKMPWGVWYNNDPITLDFPDHWNVETASMEDAPEISDDDIRSAFSHPIGSPSLAEIAKGSKTVAIAVDDLTRPTEAYRFFPHILHELRAADIKDDDITVIMAVGAHRALTRQDMIKKLGPMVVDTFRVYNHCPFDNVVPVGESMDGSPILVNRFFVEADVTITVGSIVPHPTAGWSGGGKTVMPGMCSIETLLAVHSKDRARGGGQVADIEGNRLRMEIDDIAHRIGLNVIVNAVCTAEGKTAGLFVGDFIEAHRAGIRLAKKVYATEVPSDVDVGIFNAFPEDIEFGQTAKALNVWFDPDDNLVKKGGTIVVITAASEGRGVHYLGDFGMKLFQKAENRPSLVKKIAGRRLAFLSPTVTRSTVAERYGAQTALFKDWKTLRTYLAGYHGENTHAVVFPCSSLQYLKT